MLCISANISVSMSHCLPRFYHLVLLCLGRVGAVFIFVLKHRTRDYVFFERGRGAWIITD